MSRTLDFLLGEISCTSFRTILGHSRWSNKDRTKRSSWLTSTTPPWCPAPQSKASFDELVRFSEAPEMDPRILQNFLLWFAPQTCSEPLPGPQLSRGPGGSWQLWYSKYRLGIDDMEYHVTALGKKLSPFHANPQETQPKFLSSQASVRPKAWCGESSCKGGSCKG